MKIALLGFGKMGRLIEQMALQRRHEIVARITSEEKKLDALQDADLFIDFSHEKALEQHVEWAAALHKNIVIGTTGWDERLPKVRDVVQDSQIGLLYAPNFSIGVHIFMNIVAEAAQWIDKYEEYDAALHEMHHCHKSDSPSGTALALVELLAKHIKRKSPQTLSVSSTRCGEIPGTHTLIFNSHIDSLTLTHTAHKRDGFAQGAVYAAEWLQGRQGFFTFEDIFQDR